MPAPAAGFALGTMLRDAHLVVTGCVCELIGVIETFLVGFVMGLISAGFPKVGGLGGDPAHS